MNKKDVFEIKNRFKKTGCSFTKMCGCYVNSAKEILVNFNETFLNLEEDEFYKYLEIAKKTLSGTMGNNLIELHFPTQEETDGKKQQFLMGLRQSKLKNEELLNTFYQLIIESYNYVGNYLILVFHDAYDVITKTTDNTKIDESEEVYEYLLVAICPVTLSKPGLGYLENENKIGARSRDWIVEAPESGFIFPAFTQRSADIHSTMFYAKNALEPHRELMDLVLGCPVKATADEQRKTFQNLIKNAINDSEKSEKVFSEIQESLNQIMEEQETYDDTQPEPVLLTKETVREILIENELPEEVSTKIEASYEETFSDEPPVIDYLIDKKILAENEKRKVNKVLIEQIHKLEEQLVEKSKQPIADTNYDVVLHVKSEKMDQIKTQIIDGKKCIIIPMDENEHSKVNGVEDFMF